MIRRRDACSPVAGANVGLLQCFILGLFAAPRLTSPSLTSTFGATAHLQHFPNKGFLPHICNFQALYPFVLY
jgi:hypothetical protein